MIHTWSASRSGVGSPASLTSESSFITRARTISAEVSTTSACVTIISRWSLKWTGIINIRHRAHLNKEYVKLFVTNGSHQWKLFTAILLSFTIYYHFRYFWRRPTLLNGPIPRRGFLPLDHSTTIRAPHNFLPFSPLNASYNSKTNHDIRCHGI